MSSALQTLNENNKAAQWADLITQCRNSGLSVKEWCSTNNICTQTYYRWQKRLFEMAQAQQNSHFVEVSPVQAVSVEGIAVTVRFADAEAAINNGADTSTVEAVLRILKSC